MIDFTTPKHHWNYFLAIQNDLESLSRYIEFCSANLHTYSIELAHILLSASSEVDVVMKQLCSLVESGTATNNIQDYKESIVARLPTLITEQIAIPRYGMKYQPWINWNGTAHPDWWKSHNNVKHRRNNHFPEANLQHTINAVGALLITTVYYYRFAFSAEAGHAVDFRETTRELDGAATAFLRLQETYYYQQLIT